MKNKLGLLLMSIFATTVFSQENYSTWSRYRIISVNTTSSGANVTTAVTNFPVLVRLTSANADVFSQAAAGGADIRFTDSTGATRLKHEKERWNATSQVAEFWVVLPGIPGNTITNFRMYWGKGGAADSSSSSAAFSRANNFLGVWHMGNPANASAPASSVRPNAVNPGTNDAKPYTDTAQSFASGYAVTTGMAGAADTLVGGSTGTGGSTIVPGAYFDLGTIADTGYANLAGGFTISMWARISSAPNPSASAYTRLVEISNGFNANSLTLDRNNATTTLRYELNSNATGQTGNAPNFWLADNNYHHLALTVSNSTVNSGRTVAMYLDGTPSTATLTLTAALTSTQRTAGRIGCGTPPPDRESFTGALDEVELHNADRSPGWISLSYQTQKSATTAVTIGSTQLTASVPGAPTAVTAVAGNAQVAVSWTAPSSDGGAAITAYLVTASDTSKHCSTTGGTSCTMTGLANGTAYTFTVKATNIAGTGAASAASNSVTPTAPVGVPSPPKTVTGTAGNAQVTVNWLAPDSVGSSAITGYTVTSNPDGKTCTTTGALTCVVTALTNGAAYTFTVTATNSAGISAASASSAALTPIGAPGVPTGISGVSGNAQITVSWASPTSNGGSAITGYTATAGQDTTKKCTTTGALTCTVTGLNNGTTYTFTVTATNAVGTSAASSASAPVTPATVPGAPTNVTGVGAPGQVTVSWVAPGVTGGSPITGYEVTASDNTKKCTSTGSLSCVVTGLTNTTAYTFTVTASNAVGKGAASAPSASVTGIREFARDLGIRINRSSMTLHLPEFSGTAEVSLVDLWGRKVWNKSVASGVREVSWGRGSTAIVPGLYILRIVLQDSNHKSLLAAESKILLTP